MFQVKEINSAAIVVLMRRINKWKKLWTALLGKEQGALDSSLSDLIYTNFLA